VTGPSPTARALRLHNLRASGADGVAGLRDRLPDPPWDASLAPDDPIAVWLERNGFERYAEMTVVARPLEGLGTAMPVLGIELHPYRSEWAEAFTACEAGAMEGLATYRELGEPSGFEGQAGRGAFPVALRGERIVGFAQADLPTGWVNWIGVSPDERGQGIGRLLLTEVARAVRASRGTHLAAETEADAPSAGFWKAMGFRERGRRLLLIRRA
jgi:ribosomal protein S18 acetylase RimI-like enzyme